MTGPSITRQNGAGLSAHAIPTEGTAPRPSIAALKADYLRGLTAPMDGMWGEGFTDPAPHWELRADGDLAGYYAANDEGCLMQFYVHPDFVARERALFDYVVGQDTITKAVASTIDPAFLALCLDRQQSVNVHTVMYECPEATTSTRETPLALRPVESAELQRTIDFQEMCLAGKIEAADLAAWLRGYSANLISRKEIFLLSRDDEWIGLGERRQSDSQDGVADVGMMVHPDSRKAGWATYILQLLVSKGLAEGSRVICSTTVENIGAQKAITKAGFISRHRIMDIMFV